MKKIEDFDKVKPATDFEALEIGPYICKIIAVEDLGDKEYLVINFDIADGEKKGYFKELNDAFGGDWRGRIRRSYKKKALPFFSAFIVAVEKSNPKFKWNWNEQDLVGNYVVVVFGEEEWVNDDNELKIVVKPVSVRSIQAYKENRITTPKIKRVSAEERGKAVAEVDKKNKEEMTDISDDDLPF